MKWYDYVIKPFDYCSLEKNRFALWAFFTIIIGLTGVGMNIWSHLGLNCNLIDSIKIDLEANSLFTYSIVLLTSAYGNYYMKIAKSKMLLFTTLKTWISIAIGVFVVVGAVIVVSPQKITHFYCTELGYFILSVCLSVYTFCVTNMDEHPEHFKALQEDVSDEEIKELHSMIETCQKLVKDKNDIKL